MKKSTILDIFNGLKGQKETTNVPKDTAKKNLDALHDTHNVLKEKLNPELLALHQQFVDLLENEWSEEVDFYFVEGFKLGLLVGIECMED